METCSCVNLNLVPVAILEADYSLTDGAVIRVRSDKSEWNEMVSANPNLRQIRWYILSNGYQVAMTPFLDLRQGIDFANAIKVPPSVSTGATLEFNNAESDVRAYLISKGVMVSQSANLEIQCEIINGSLIRSELSNRILLNSGTDCCEDEAIYDVWVNGATFCLSSQTGECYEVQVQV